ncbi:F-actin-capping protein subunit beta [Pseudonaja textilis]|uniref:F-actin-capping protein subunit beta n=1 Tax=Pseudonaja textilis TaxID=8673 RepID=UPI000EAA5160|nr:F-actin-capping protein subunit beta [Pseudonaja textilis]
MSEQQLDCALDLMRRLPPQQIEKNLSDLIDLEKSSGRTAHYKLTSTVMLWLQTNKTGSGTMNLGGSLTRQMEKDETVSDSSPHIANIGRLVEDMENKIRSTLNEIYFGKTKDIVNGLRSVQTFADKSKQEALKNDLVEALKRKQQS